jgi:DNA-binding response OmpR family regulator
MPGLRPGSGRITLVEDDRTLRAMLAQRLDAEGYDVHEVDSPQQLVDLSAHYDADLVISPISEPGPTVEGIRKQSDVLLIAVMPVETGLMEALDVVDAGADDVLIKPFSPRELVTKIRALLRRNGQNTLSHPLVFEGLSIDIRAREVTVMGEIVELPAREFDLLVFLARSPKQVFTRAQIMQQVWSIDDGLGTATVTEHVRRLRARIEPDPAHPRWIQTVWSVGYRFVP